MAWLVTGGAGYIGQHVVRALLDQGHGVVVVDNLSTGDGALLPTAAQLVVGDICRAEDLDRAFTAAALDGVIHLAALKSARGSLHEPLEYYRTNIGGTVELLAAMLRHDVRPIVFSSSCSVYGAIGGAEPITEDEPTLPVSPYGRSKLTSELVAADAVAAHGLSCLALRYFNVAGAGAPELGDRSDHNLVPLVIRAAVTGTTPLIYGDDHGTPDGTCVRDYIDVRDLAEAHVLAASLASAPDHNWSVYNVGTGTGHSVREVISAIAEASGEPLSPRVEASKPGDPPAAVADGSRLAAATGWRPRRGMGEIASSAWVARASSLVPVAPHSGH